MLARKYVTKWKRSLPAFPGEKHVNYYVMVDCTQSLQGPYGSWEPILWRSLNSISNSNGISLKWSFMFRSKAPHWKSHWGSGRIETETEIIMQQLDEDLNSTMHTPHICLSIFSWASYRLSVVFELHISDPPDRNMEFCFGDVQFQFRNWFYMSVAIQAWA